MNVNENHFLILGMLHADLVGLRKNKDLNKSELISVLDQINTAVGVIVCKDEDTRAFCISLLRIIETCKEWTDRDVTLALNSASIGVLGLIRREPAFY